MQDNKGLYWYLCIPVCSNGACDDTCLSSLSFIGLHNGCLTANISNYYNAHYE